MPANASRVGYLWLIGHPMCADARTKRLYGANKQLLSGRNQG